MNRIIDGYFTLKNGKLDLGFQAANTETFIFKTRFNLTDKSQKTNKSGKKLENLIFNFSFVSTCFENSPKLKILHATLHSTLHQRQFARRCFHCFHELYEQMFQTKASVFV